MFCAHGLTHVTEIRKGFSGVILSTQGPAETLTRLVGLIVSATVDANPASVPRTQPSRLVVSVGTPVYQGLS